MRQGRPPKRHAQGECAPHRLTGLFFLRMSSGNHSPLSRLRMYSLRATFHIRTYLGKRKRSGRPSGDGEGEVDMLAAAAERLRRRAHFAASMPFLALPLPPKVEWMCWNAVETSWWFGSTITTCEDVYCIMIVF